MMLPLKDILSVLDRWDEWKHIKDAAARVPDLEGRIIELEKLLDGKAPHDYCPKCRKRAFHLETAHGDGTGVYKCDNCNLNFEGPLKL